MNEHRSEFFVSVCFIRHRSMVGTNKNIVKTKKKNCFLSTKVFVFLFLFPFLFSFCSCVGASLLPNEFVNFVACCQWWQKERKMIKTKSTEKYRCLLFVFCLMVFYGLRMKMETKCSNQTTISIVDWLKVGKIICENDEFHGLLLLSYAFPFLRYDTRQKQEVAHRTRANNKMRQVHQKQAKINLIFFHLFGMQK